MTYVCVGNRNDEFTENVVFFFVPTSSWADPEGGRPPSPKNRQKYGFLAYWSVSLYNHKATMPAFDVESSAARQGNPI